MKYISTCPIFKERAGKNKLLKGKKKLVCEECDGRVHSHAFVKPLYMHHVTVFSSRGPLSQMD